jgi:CRISPR type I-E-associated protein CasB/Cse2
MGPVGDQVLETVAGLFAYHPEETDMGAFGITCRELARENSSFEGRFRRLLSCSDRGDVCGRLRPIVLAARAKKIKVNYEELLIDLRCWSDRVKARWAGEFWGSAHPEEPSMASEATT